MRPILTASDALAELDALTEVELFHDGPIPAAERESALARIAAARAWIEAHPAEVAAERAARREALYQAAADADASWARAQRYRRPDAATVARVVR